MVDIEGTVVLATLVADKKDSDRDFFPLTVNYIEKTYAAGKIPGGFFKREGRPTESETLISRLVDRPLRPLFDSLFTREVQLTLTLLSHNPAIDPEVPALIAASAAVKLSGLPFNGTLGAVKVGFDGNDYTLNPTNSELKNSLLNLTVAGTQNAVMMVESEAKGLSEEVMLGAVNFGHSAMQPIINAIDELYTELNIQPISWEPTVFDNQSYETFFNKYKDQISSAYQIIKKQDRNENLGSLKDEIFEAEAGADDDKIELISSFYEKAQKEVVRKRILDGEKRIDGRDTTTVRPIDVRVGVLPRTHGSAHLLEGKLRL